jgi:hypothetical protein
MGLPSTVPLKKRNAQDKLLAKNFKKKASAFAEAFLGR